MFDVSKTISFFFSARNFGRFVLGLPKKSFCGLKITHHWPEVRFTIVNEDGTPTDGLMYHVPGWDAWLRYKQLSNSSYFVNGHVRVQKYEKTSDLNYKARLVTRYAISSDNRLKVPELKDNTPLYVKINGEGEVKNIRGLQYKDIFETTYNAETKHNEGPDGTNYDVDIIDEDKGTVLSTYKDADNYFVGFRNFVIHCISVVSKIVFLKRNKPAPKLC